MIHVVQEEVVSQQMQKLSEPFKAILRKLRTLQYELPASELLSSLEEHQSGIERLSEGAAQSVRDEFKDWLTQLGAECHAVAPKHGEQVLQTYFAGAPPL